MEHISNPDLTGIPAFISNYPSSLVMESNFTGTIHEFKDERGTVHLQVKHRYSIHNKRTFLNSDNLPVLSMRERPGCNSTLICPGMNPLKDEYKFEMKWKNGKGELFTRDGMLALRITGKFLSSNYQVKLLDGRVIGTIKRGWINTKILMEAHVDVVVMSAIASIIYQQYY